MTDRSPKNAARLIKQECDELKRMLLRKNKAYGNSAVDPVRIFSKASSVEQIKVRLDDKLSRMARGKAAGEDVILDLLGYLILMQVTERIEKRRRKCSSRRSTRKKRSAKERRLRKG